VWPGGVRAGLRVGARCHVASLFPLASLQNCV
jgi:hypothetical protein